MQKILLVLLSSLLGWGCASGRAIVRIECPKPPLMVRVVVTNKTIKGNEVNHVIENHQRLWQHIRLLEKLGCTTRQ